ncbi:MAG TPA: ABC transporter ATP-binding protein [Anaerolineae bacterium]|nr:ABC transporter ATP-binding protein [Anaerolineae bacterium]HQH39295.1 ABC transporter ATP-binding protein [Anaerolineae bacterium]
MDTDVVLEVRNITKQFPGVLANDHVSFQLHRGEILALLGENGAGKTTLMNIIYGLYHQDDGEVFIQGESFRALSPRDAITRGVGMVHQHFQLVEPMTVTENIILGSEVMRNKVFLDIDRARLQVDDFSRRYGLEVNPDAVIEDLPVGIQQRVEIIKALYRQAQILILDEPTAVLTPQEIEDLFRVMRHLVEQGHSIIFITHKLKEVLAVAHRIVVMRNGRVVGEALPASSTQGSLASMMVGREVILKVPKGPANPGAVVLDVQNLHVCDERGQTAVKGVTFQVRAGEILGVAGVQGNGQTELVEAVTGLRPLEEGRMILAEKDVSKAPPRRFTEQGSGHIPENRHRYGMVEPYPVSENLVLNCYYTTPFARGWVRDYAAIDAYATHLIELFDVRTPSIATPAGNLSGGNQQKMVVARELGRKIALLVAAQPTRGLDVGSIEFIHGQIVKQRDAGVAVLLVSSELDEIMALADRIIVMYKGEIIGEVDAATATREQLGLLMAGVRPEQAESA